MTFKALARVEEGMWRIYGLEVPNTFASPGEGSPQLVKFDFENPTALFDEMATEVQSNLKQTLADPLGGSDGRREEAERGSLLRSLDRASYEELWRSELTIENRPAIEVVQELADRASLELEASPELETELSKPISLKTEGSIWRLLEDVCRTVGIYPKYASKRLIDDTGTRVSFARLPRPSPISFAGPAVVELNRVMQFEPHATGMLVLQASFPDSLQAIEPPTDLGSCLTIAQVTNDAGDELSDPLSQELIRGSIKFEFRHMLKGLFREVASIKSCRGKVRFRLPAKVDELVFDDLAQGTERSTAGIVIKLKLAGKRPALSFEGGSKEEHIFDFEWEGISRDHVTFIAYDANHNALARNEGGSSYGNRHETNLSTSQDVATIQVKLITATEDVEYPFELKDIPLDKSSLQSDALIVLEISDDVPASVDFEGIAEGKVPRLKEARFRVSNHTNKAIRLFELELSGADANGRNVKRRFTHVADYVIGGDEEFGIIVDAMSAASITTPSFSLPNENGKPSTKVLRIRFADGSEWKNTN